MYIFTKANIWILTNVWECKKILNSHINLFNKLQITDYKTKLIATTKPASIKALVYTQLTHIFIPGRKKKGMLDRGTKETCKNTRNITYNFQFIIKYIFKNQVLPFYPQIRSKDVY